MFCQTRGTKFLLPYEITDLLGEKDSRVVWPQAKAVLDNAGVVMEFCVMWAKSGVEEKRHSVDSVVSHGPVHPGTVLTCYRPFWPQIIRVQVYTLTKIVQSQ